MENKVRRVVQEGASIWRMVRRLLLSTVRIYCGVSTIDREFISTEPRVSSLYFSFKIRILSRGTGPRLVSRGRKIIQFVQPGREFARSLKHEIYLPSARR